jgi:hypothetical protein
MSRRRKSRGFPPGLLIILIVLLAGGVYWILARGGKEGSLRTVEELDPAIYYVDANSLRGNTYRIDAEIDSALGNSPSRGRLFSVVLKKAGIESGKDGIKGGAPVIIPVLVPIELGKLTIQKGQHYLMKVKVGDNGLLIVEEARKP